MLKTKVPYHCSLVVVALLTSTFHVIWTFLIRNCQTMSLILSYSFTRTVRLLNPQKEAQISALPILRKQDVHLV